MSWFPLALIATVGWGTADLFYKKASDENDRYSHLRTAVWVGLVMGITSLALLPFSETDFSVSSFFRSLLLYSPASLFYILSMIIGYAGLRYLALSVISPVQNASGALSTVLMLILFFRNGSLNGFSEAFSPFDLIGTGLVIVGVIALAMVENRLAAPLKKDEVRFRKGAAALLFPLGYCLFDTLGTAADGVILQNDTLGELDVICLYGITFFAVGVSAWLFLFFKTKKPYFPFSKKELSTNGAAALSEEFGQVFYVYAMARRPLLAAPMIGSYCILSVILSRVFLREKPGCARYLCVFTVIAGIVLLGISEGLAA